MKKDTPWIQDHIIAILHYMMLLVKVICVFSNLFELVEEKNPRGYKGHMPIQRAAKKAIFQYSNLYMKNLRTNILRITEVGCQFIMLPVLAS